MVVTERRGIIGIDAAGERSICTSPVERNILTIRTFMRRLTRLSLGYSKKLCCSAASVGMFAAYYNFVWRTRHTDRSKKCWLASSDRRYDDKGDGPPLAF
jgi:hypothetical protein